MKLFQLFLMSTLLAVSSLSLASGSAKIAISNGETMSLAWLDNGSVHMSTSHEKNSYILLLKNKVYAIHKEDGRYQALDLSSLIEGLGALAEEMSPVSIDKELEIDWDANRLKKTGKTETVAGITGDIYQLEENNKGEFIVLSDNKTAQEMTAAYFLLMQAITAQNDKINIDRALPKNQQGLLQAGKNFKLISLSNKKPSHSLFKLPAEPQNLGEMMNQMQKMKQH